MNLLHLIFVTAVYAQEFNGVPVVTSPGVNPVLAFDPLAYAAGAVTLSLCPGFEQFKGIVKFSHH